MLACDHGPILATSTRFALVVDDELAVRYVLRRFLERCGWQVLDAENAAGAMLLVADVSRRIDVVVVDLHLPDDSGSTLCSRISALRPWLASRILVASGDAFEAGRALARESLCCPVLAKPFHLMELERALNGLVAA